MEMKIKCSCVLIHEFCSFASVRSLFFFLSSNFFSSPSRRDIKRSIVFGGIFKLYSLHFMHTHLFVRRESGKKRFSILRHITFPFSDSFFSLFLQKQAKPMRQSFPSQEIERRRERTTTHHMAMGPKTHSSESS